MNDHVQSEQGVESPSLSHWGPGDRVISEGGLGPCKSVIQYNTTQQANKGENSPRVYIDM